ncbi:uncharacterized protein LOC101898722 [Musca domestica]|uniref:Uncharacterized protein LOC101898722 n=1 Tax=Musca domestica TaxID=7370 RepID=A0A9J7I466_MUSDO|nr:uncharacterized protein LOC101898722 [Musca domestica]
MFKNPGDFRFVDVVLLFTLSVIVFGKVAEAKLFEENTKFCLRTEPMLLADIEKHKSPQGHNKSCEIVATLLTSLEKESFRNTMCKDHGSSHKDAFYFLKLYNGDLVGRGTYHEICKGEKNPLLAWIPYEMMQKYYAQELNPKERLNYMAKATDVSREKTELCHFRHSDLVENIPDNLFTCVVMIFEDNFYGLESSINVLVEIKPLMYELRNVTFMPWVNSTISYKTLLGRTYLKNPSRERKQIYGNFNYEYVEKVELNLSSIYQTGMRRLPLLFEHKNAVLKIDDKGIGGMDVKEKAYFGRKMEPKTKVRVDIIGQWAEDQQEFSADIYEYFGYGVKRFHNEMQHGNVTFMRIESTEPVYEMPEEDDIVIPQIHSIDGKPFERMTAAEDDDMFGAYNETDEDFRDDLEALFEDGMITDVIREDTENESDSNSGFYPWFILVVLIVGGILVGTVYLVSRHYGAKDERRRYKFTGI